MKFINTKILFLTFFIASLINVICLHHKLHKTHRSDKHKIHHRYHHLQLNFIQANMKLTNTTSNTTSTDSPKNKTCGRSVGELKQAQIFVQNPDLDFLNKEEIKQLTKDEKCTIKSGLIYMIEKAKSYVSEIKLVQVYLKADTSTIKLFQSSNPASEFHEIKMPNFIKIGQIFKGSNCFDLIAGQEPNGPQDIKSKRGGLTLCTLNQKEEQNWVSGLMKLKECVSGVKTDQNLLADFQKLNQNIHNINEANKPPIHTVGMFYTDSNVYDGYKPLHLSQGETVSYQKKITTQGKVINIIENEGAQPATDPLEIKVQEIKDIVKADTLHEQKVKKILAKKFIEAKKTNSMVHKKKEIIQRLIESRAQLEKQKHEEIVKIEQVKRQSGILDKAKEEIQSAKKSSLEKIKQVFKR